MLQQEVQNALREERPVPPKGFEARSDAQLLRLTAEKKTVQRKPRVAVVLVALLLVLGIATGLAATVESINEKLYTYWPELAEALMPVNADCESLGIRMEVESAVVKDNKAMVTFSMQDLEGDRLNEYSYADFDEFSFPLENTKNPGISSTSLLLSYDAEAKKATFVQEIEYDQPIKTGEYEVSLHIPFVDLKDMVVEDLHPILETHGETPAVLPASQADVRMIWGFNIEIPEMPEDLKVLDYTRNPEIRIQDHVAISGIGWIDGQLHVQIHYIDNGMIRNKAGTVFYPPVRVHILTQLADGWSPWRRYADRLQEMVFCVRMGGDEDQPEWEEYIFPCSPAEIQEGTLEAQITLNDTVKTLDGFWTVDVPLQMIQYE